VPPHASTAAEEVVADLFFTSEGRRAPYPRYARLRELAPVHYSTALQAWFATRYAD
jgi:cytochrome P450